MKNIARDTIDRINYKLPSSKLLTLILVGAILFVLGFTTNFSLEKKINAIVAGQVSLIETKMSTAARFVQGGGCQITYDRPSLSLLFPSYTIKNLSLSSGCIQGPSGINLKEVEVALSGLNPWPLGVNISLEAQLKKIRIKAYLTQSLSGQVITIKDNQILLDELTNIVNSKLQMRGRADLTLQLSLKNQVMTDMVFKLESKDLILPAQSIETPQIGVLQLPELNVKKLYLLAKSKKQNTINFENFTIGDNKSPLRVEMKGKVALSPQNMARTNLDLSGQFALSETILKKFAIIKIFLGKLNKKDDFYQFKLTGPLAKPSLISE